MPLISVVTPLYNSGGFMNESIQSVLQQSHADLELILVDDCSQDDSLARAHRYGERDDRVLVVPLPKNQGGAAARNAGIARAGGRYIAFLDADDVWEADKLSIQLAGMEAKGAAFSYTDYAVMTRDGEVKRTHKAPDRMAYSDLLKNTAIGCSTVIYDRQAIGDRFFPTIRRRHDLALWLSILRDIEFAYRCGPALTRYRIRPGSLSSGKLRAAASTWRVYRQLERLPLPLAAYYFARYAAAAIRKRL